MVRLQDIVRRWRGLMLRIPPVTALLSITMILAYYKGTEFQQFLERKEFSWAWRALLSAFYYKNELHLILDLTWIFIIGTRLEKVLGSWRFLYTTSLMIFLTQGFSLLINPPSYTYLTKHPQNVFLRNYTSGFSGVLFAFHFLLIAYSSHHPHLAIHHYHELLVQGLVIIASFQALILPDGHFFNNLSGIVAGFVYVNTPPILWRLVSCGMAIYSETLRFMSSIDWEALHQSARNSNGRYYANDNHHGQEGVNSHSYAQEGANGHYYGNDNHQGQEGSNSHNYEQEEASGHSYGNDNHQGQEGTNSHNYAQEEASGHSYGGNDNHQGQEGANSHNYAQEGTNSHNYDNDNVDQGQEGANGHDYGNKNYHNHKGKEVNGHSYGKNNHQGPKGTFSNHCEVEQEEEEEEEDVHLEWKCKACFKKNGVFFSFCEVCTQPRV